MDRNERYLMHHQAAYIHNLMGDPGFPTDLLIDRGFTRFLREIIPSTPYEYLMVHMEELEEQIHRHLPKGLRRRGRKSMRTGEPRTRLLQGVIDVVRHGLKEAMQDMPQSDLTRAPYHQKIQRIADIFELDPTEQAILRYYCVLEVDSLFQSIIEDSTLEVMRNRFPKFLGCLLDIQPSMVGLRIGVDSRMRKTQLLESREVLHKHHQGISLNENVLKILASESLPPERIVEAFYRREPSPGLETEDFDHLSQELTLVTTLLQDAWKHHKTGTNILLYGAAGLGKTEFARLAGQRAEASIFAVPRRDESDGDAVRDNFRRMAYDIFHRMCRGEQRPLLVVDEADSLLGGAVNPLAQLLGMEIFGESGGCKAWLTEALVENPLPVIWIVNNHAGMHPAVRRRFTASIHFPALPESVLRRVWQSTLQRAGRRFQLEAPVITTMLQSYDLSPGNIAQAVDTWRRISGRQKPQVSQLHQVLGHMVRLVNNVTAPVKLRNLDTGYDPALLNLEGGLQADSLANIIRRFYELKATHDAGAPHQVTLLFHGPPGTGKTELAKYLGSQAERKVQVERTSDLLGPYVGQTEKQIAAAFTEASERGAILLLDEFDSLAFHRSGATKSWETTRVNEMLQQIENYPGVLIVCTNLLENLDQAIARRFSHKVGFGGIPKEKRGPAVARYFNDWLDGEKLPWNLNTRLERLPSLYPGDLRAARQKHALDYLQGNPPGAETLVATLEKEASFRKVDAKPIGFQG